MNPYQPYQSDKVTDLKEQISSILGNYCYYNKIKEDEIWKHLPGWGIHDYNDVTHGTNYDLTQKFYDDLVDLSSDLYKRFEDINKDAKNGVFTKSVMG